MDVDLVPNEQRDTPLPNLPVDLDADGVTELEGDCDDNDPAVGPEIAEQCDGIDNNCDMLVDENKCVRVDVFAQTLQLDMLFVIDTSASMAPYLERLADGVAACDTQEYLLPHLVGPPFDTHIGVVTMDVHDPETMGELVTVNGRSFVQGDDPKYDCGSVQEWFTDAVTGNTTITGTPPAARAAVSALVDRFQSEDGNNFLRPDGALQIVFVSDRDDATVLPTITGFRDKLAEVKGTLAKVTFHAIVQGDEYNCAGELSEDTEGASYLTLVDQTGLDLSICEPDYGGWFTALGQTAATQGLENTFELKKPAQTGSVTVTVTRSDGTSEAFDDVYLGDGNRSVLLTAPLPPAGSTISVRYLCDPAAAECE